MTRSQFEQETFTTKQDDYHFTIQSKLILILQPVEKCGREMIIIMFYFEKPLPAGSTHLSLCTSTAKKKKDLQKFTQTAYSQQITSEQIPLPAIGPYITS